MFIRTVGFLRPSRYIASTKRWTANAALFQPPYEVPFKTNISLITPKAHEQFFFEKMKLMYVKHNGVVPGIGLMKNVASNFDYWIVRQNQSLLLYYRVELFSQRLNYLDSVGLTTREKLAVIQKSPPMLLFTFTNESYTAKLVYQRGLARYKEGFMHIFYPVTHKVVLSKNDIQERVDNIGKRLQLPQAMVIRELLNMPCFFMQPFLLNAMNHMFVHKHSMPHLYSIDLHTMAVLPPVCNLSPLKLDPSRHFSNKVTSSLIRELPSYDIEAVQDYSYPQTHGGGTEECLSQFLTRAELEEKKDRTGGQPVKGRRGFNVPKRQY